MHARLHMRVATVLVVALVTVTACRNQAQGTPVGPAGRPASGTAVTTTTPGAAAQVGATAVVTATKGTPGASTPGAKVVVPTATIEYSGPPTLRSDGIYMARIPERMQGYFYLRFYDDGTVLSASAYAGPGEVTEWFRKGGPYGGKATYTLKGDQLGFTTVSKNTTVDYSGTVYGSQALVLHMRSETTKWEDTLVFRFAEVTVH